MKIIQAVNESALAAFIAVNNGVSGAEFLLGPEWCAGLRAEGREVETWAVVRDLDYGGRQAEAADFLAVITLVKKPLSQRFFYWYAPRGPLLKKDLSASEADRAFKLLISGVRRLSRRALFLKLEPSNEVELVTDLVRGSHLKVVSDIQPRQTLILDLNQKEEDILGQMHQKTRYNIRLAERKEIQIIQGAAADFKDFWRLMAQTSERDNFRLHDEEHYHHLVARVGGGNNEGKNEGGSSFASLRLFFAEYQGEKIAAALVYYCGRKATYLHGASDYEKRQLMAPYLLQWEIIRQAKAEGVKIYDFYGIDAVKWPGVTRFKLGFGGEERVYAGTYDAVFRPALYRSYQLFKAFKKMIAR